MSMDMYKMMIDAPEENNKLMINLAKEIYEKGITKEKMNLEITSGSLRKFTVDISRKKDIINIHIEFEKESDQDISDYARLTIDMSKGNFLNKGEVLNSDTNIFGPSLGMFLQIIIEKIKTGNNVSYNKDKLRISTNTTQQLSNFKG